MIGSVITWSTSNSFLVLLATAFIIRGLDRRKPGYRSPVIGRLLLRARSQVSGGSAQRQRRAWFRPSAKTCSL
jgi:hypothetical protein